MSEVVPLGLAIKEECPEYLVANYNTKNQSRPQCLTMSEVVPLGLTIKEECPEYLVANFNTKNQSRPQCLTMSGVIPLGLTIKEECPEHLELAENAEALGADDKFSVLVKKEISVFKKELNYIVDRKTKAEHHLFPVVKIERNFELEEALKGKIKNEPQDGHVKPYAGYCERLNVSEDKSFPNQLQNIERYDSISLSMVICVSCNRCYKENNDLNDHICSSTIKNPYSGSNHKTHLNIDELTYENDSKNSKHMGYVRSGYRIRPSSHENAHQNWTYGCEICGSKFKNKRPLSRHCKIHLVTSIKGISCLHCEKSFKTKVELNSHLITHSESKNFSCGHCNKLFKRKTGLFKHIQHFHSGEPKRYKCGECPKSFTYKQYLKDHKLKLHSNCRPLICSECGATFKDRYSLKLHTQLHSGIRPHSCTLCDKKFSQIPHLKRHELFHTGVKPYLCKICGKSFRDSSNFKVHQLLHKGLRPFKCDKCGKCFTQRSHLNTHKKTHNEERPFICQVCGDSFKVKTSLRSHVLLHSDIKPYNCEECGKSFVQQTPFKRHKCYRKFE